MITKQENAKIRLPFLCIWCWKMPLHVSGALPERFTKGAIGQYLADLNAFSTQVVWEDAVARINGTLPEEHVVCFELPSFQQLVCLEAVGVASYFSNLQMVAAPVSFAISSSNM